MTLQIVSTPDSGFIKRLMDNATIGAKAPSAKGTLYDPNYQNNVELLSEKHRPKVYPVYPVIFTKEARDKAIEQLHRRPALLETLLNNSLGIEHLTKKFQRNKITHGWYWP